MSIISPKHSLVLQCVLRCGTHVGDHDVSQPPLLLKGIKLCHSSLQAFSLHLSEFLSPLQGTKFARDLVFSKLPFTCCWMVSYSSPSLGSDNRCHFLAYYVVTRIWKSPSQSIWGSENHRQLLSPEVGSFRGSTKGNRRFNLRELR